VIADGEDLVFVTVEALDADGRPHSLADNLIHFTVDGPGEIAAVGNGNPLSFEPFQADRRQLFYGKALLILRPKEGAGGKISVRATATELTAAELLIETLAADGP
jgi:beta-galactosidase